MLKINRKSVNRAVTISVLLLSFRAIGLPIASVRCTVQDEITDPKGFSTIAKKEGIVNDVTPFTAVPGGAGESP